jgi:hypothetical protein
VIVDEAEVSEAEARADAEVVAKLRGR